MIGYILRYVKRLLINRFEINSTYKLLIKDKALVLKDWRYILKIKIKSIVDNK